MTAVLYRYVLGAAVNEQVIRDFTEQVEDYLRTKVPFVLLIDAEKLASIPDAMSRNALATWLERVSPDVARYNVATAIVYRSPVVELLIRALSWFAPPPNPQFHTTDVEAAERWCVEQCGQESRPASFIGQTQAIGDSIPP